MRTLFGERTRGVLVIDDHGCLCGSCGRPAEPDELTHRTVIGADGTPEPVRPDLEARWAIPGDTITNFSSQPQDAGCGVRWTRIGSTRAAGAEEGVAMQLRPDLEWIELNP